MDDFNEDLLFSKAAIVGNANPLSQYFRVPGVHIKLPSQGKFFMNGEYESAMNNEVAIYPMSAADEMVLKSPDALMSGYALEKLFGSCAPMIKNPRSISMPDIDVLLLAIRAATYGNTLSLDIKCPKCETEQSVDCDLASLLSTTTYIDEADAKIELNEEITIFARPYNLINTTRLATVAFEETSLLRSLEGDGFTEKEKMEKMNESMKRINALNLELIADCILGVVTPQNKVSDKNHIREFVDNISKSWIEKINKKVKKMNDCGVDKKFSVTCTACNHEWTTEVEFDPTNFFDNN